VQTILENSASAAAGIPVPLFNLVYHDSILFVATLVLASSAMANTVVYQGLSHTSLGGAVLFPSGGDLTVNNIGSSGLDGVAVDMDPAGLYQMSWLPLDPTNVTPDVELLKISARGSVGGGPLQSLGQSTLTRTAGGTNFEINADFTAVGSATLQVVLLLGGTVQEAQPALSGPGPEVFGVDGTDLPQTVKVGIPPLFRGGGLGFSWVFGSQLLVAIPGSVPIMSDEIRMFAEIPSGSVDFVSEFSVLARDIPQNQIAITDSVAQPIPIPEPASAALIGLSLMMLLGYKRPKD